jgi:hypothetical protein
MAILTPDGVKHAHFDQTLPDRFACRPRLQQAAACFSAGVSVPERQSFGAVCYGRGWSDDPGVYHAEHHGGRATAGFPLNRAPLEVPRVNEALTAWLTDTMGTPTSVPGDGK